MGGGTSKPAIDPTKLIQAPDISRASYSAEYVQNLAKQNAEALKKAFEEKKSKSWFDFSKTNWWKWIVYGVIFLAIAIPSAIGISKLVSLIQGKSSSPSVTPPAPIPTPTPPEKILYIDSATYGVPSQTVDVSGKVKGMITSDYTAIQPPVIVGPSTLGLPADPQSGVINTLTVTYHYGGGSSKTLSVEKGEPFSISPPTIPTPPAPPSGGGGKSGGGNDPMVKGVLQQSPTLFQRVSNFFSGSSGGASLQSSIQDATTTSTIPGGSAPLSVGADGSYGMQWWMFIKDWNYGYGKQKSVIKRSDPSSQSVTNPNISLHPTDNSLVISVSVFPATEGGSSKAEPAPYGHSASTDDVFVCEVPNLPLQSWFSVSTTIFGRNMDVYIDGKLVKSCFLSGVPKPAVGDVELTPGGGFSGYVCDFTHFSRMLTPDDAIAFYNAGTNCQSATQPSAATDATGYSVKFGVYDATGKEVKEYAF